jgi:fused signal recognition particle receptor
MVFNWFRRKFNEESEPAKPEETPAAAPEVEETPAVEEPAASTAADDYLQWAKAAYQNIQKKQQDAVQPETVEAEAENADVQTSSVEAVAAEMPVLASPGVPEPTVEDFPELEPEPEPEPEPETVEVEAEAEAAPELESPPESVTESVPESEVADEVSAEEPVADEVSAEEPVAEEPVVEEPVAEEPVAEEPEPAAPMSFLARAEAERAARMERLSAEAIESPEEPKPEAAVAAADDGPLDEDFLWSARVLASQGRRPDEVSAEEINWLKKLRQGLDKTRRGMLNQLKAIVGQGPLNKEAVMEIEELLLQADVGIDATDTVIEALQEKLRSEALPPEEAIAYLKDILRQMLDRPFQDKYKANLIPEKDTLNIWLIVGVNGAGKTTTIGKLAHLAGKSDYRCLIAAADTFRAAAVKQVQVWGSRTNTGVIANPGQNTDPAAVVYDAIAAAQSRKTELLLVDTAGRLQNKKNLMDELNKIRRIIDTKAPNAVVESLLVLDATLGQNGLRQAEVFAEAAQLSGTILTKLDGTAKGGVALAVVRELGLPIHFIGAGEGIEDLRPFSSYEFVEALLNG